MIGDGPRRSESDRWIDWTVDLIFGPHISRLFIRSGLQTLPYLMVMLFDASGSGISDRAVIGQTCSSPVLCSPLRYRSFPMVHSGIIEKVFIRPLAMVSRSDRVPLDQYYPCVFNHIPTII